MKTDARLERYLKDVDSALQPIPLSERAEVIVSIKTYVKKELEKDPQARLDEVLARLGSPEAAANRYRLERGLRPAKPAINAIVKWLVIGFLSSMAMVFLFLGFLFHQMTAMVRWDNGVGSFQMFDKLLDDESKKFGFSFKGGWGIPPGLDDSRKSAGAIAGSLSLTPGQMVAIKFSSAELRVKTAPDQNFVWNCDGEAMAPLESGATEGIASLDLTPVNDADCDLQVPKGAVFSLDGNRGQVEFDEPLFAINARIETGEVEFRAAANADYKYDMTVGSGVVDKFRSSSRSSALPITVHVKTGRIQSEHTK